MIEGVRELEIPTEGISIHNTFKVEISTIPDTRTFIELTFAM